MKITFGKIARITIALTIPATSHAANLAFDNASSSAYNDGWADGSNGGTGWGPWSLTTQGFDAGFFISSSITNGNGLDDGNVGGVPGDSDIDTTQGLVGAGPAINVTTPVSFGMFSGFMSLAEATRSFTGGPLGIGQGFMMDFDNGFVVAGGGFGIELLNAGGATLWRLSYQSFDDTYSYTNSLIGTSFSTGLGPGTEGLRLAFELLAPDAYSMSLERRDGERFDLSLGSLILEADQEITQLRIFAAGTSFDSFDDPSADLFINSMMVIPEPSTSLLGALAGLGLLLRRKRA